MIHIPDVKSSVIKNYLTEAKTAYLNFLDSVSKNKDFRRLTFYLTDTVNNDWDYLKIERILIGRRKELMSIIKTVGKIGKKDATNNLYNSFKKTSSYRLLGDNLKISTCPYCNMSFIFTLKYRKVKPEFDHYFPQAHYSYLAISLFNLIPCCSSCNAAKSDADPTETSIIYPYEEEFGTDVFFDFKYDSPTDLINGNKPIYYELNYNTPTKPTWFDNSAYTIFKLNDYYLKHREYIKNIILLTRIYGNGGLLTLRKYFPWISGIRIDYLKSLMYVNYNPADKWHEKILSKITFDVVKRFESK